MNCDKIQSVLSEYIDGVLDSSSAKELEAHLENCPDCRNELEMLRKAVSLLNELPEVRPPADMLERIRREISDECRVRQPLSLTRFFLLPQTQLALAACLVLSVCIYGYRHLDLGHVDDTLAKDQAEVTEPAAAPAVSDGLQIVLEDQAAVPPADKPEEIEEAANAAEKRKISDMKLAGRIAATPEPSPAPLVEREAMLKEARPQPEAAVVVAGESPSRGNKDMLMDEAPDSESVNEGQALLGADLNTVTFSKKTDSAKGGQRLESYTSRTATAPPRQILSKSVTVDSLANSASLSAETEADRDTAGSGQTTIPMTNIVVASIATRDAAAARELLRQYSVETADKRRERAQSRASIAGQVSTNVVEITILQQKLPELVQKLRDLGMLTIQTWSTARGERTVTVRVTIGTAPPTRP